MQEQLSKEPSPSLSEAVSEIKSSIQTLNNPKKVFILSQQFITDTIKDHLQREGILNCSLICWYLEHQKYPPLIFKKLLLLFSIFICVNDQPELYYEVKRNIDGLGFAALVGLLKV